MKANVVYSSIYSARLWRKTDDGVLETKMAGTALWRKAGWPEPEMTERDIDYYIATGEMSE